LIGLTGQFAAVDDALTGAENLRLIARLLELPRPRARDRVAEVLDRFGLTDAAGRPVRTYSGGMRRRLDLAVSLVATPPVLFLDEPTTGLDPRSRVELWDVLRDLVREGTTLLLTTQYLEEADQLADDIVVIDRGTVIAQGTPLQLKDASGKASLGVTVSRPADLAAAVERVRETGLEVHVEEAARRITAPAEGLSDVTRIAALFDGSGIEIDDLGLQRPSLDDVFLHLTGHRAEEAEQSDDHDADRDHSESREVTA
jgi:ABC-2 type transport system ATP-binding protein